VELETGLYFRECPGCRGHWLPSFNYWSWRAMHGPGLPIRDPDDETVKATDRPEPKDCPECGTRLAGYAVGHGVPFHLDRCLACGGTWFDADEWAILRHRQMHDDIDRIFMSAWQESLSDEDRETWDLDYARRLDPDDFRKLRRFRAWVDAHPQRKTLIAYLRHERPD
jgi:Zn-finger nucleic acid-binding protein